MKTNSLNKNLPCLIVAFVLIFPQLAYSQWQRDGHLKYRVVHTDYSENSLFQDFFGNSNTDQAGNFRYNFDWNQNQWAAEINYEMTALYGDSVEVSRLFPDSPIIPDRLPNDDNRLFDLTKVISDDEKFAWLHRLDRLNFTYQGNQDVVKVGRQAISWGNGLIYTPMDFFNPFDPAAIDKEYKTGDDMIYGQHLFNNGDDLQGVVVGRRNEEGTVTSDVMSVAFKYHGFIGTSELDLLASQHFNDKILAAGGVQSIGGAVWRGDLVYTDTGSGDFTSLVTSISYSWIGFGKNMSGIIEYFHNGFGISNGDYSPQNLAQNPELVERIVRGELFTLGQDYLSGSVTIEANPLWLMIPNLFYNLSDNSALFQFISQHDLRQNLQLVAALILPFGADGTEYGGIETGIPNTYFSNDWSVYAQLAWYF